MRTRREEAGRKRVEMDAKLAKAVREVVESCLSSSEEGDDEFVRYREGRKSLRQETERIAEKYGYNPEGLLTAINDCW